MFFAIYDTQLTPFMNGRIVLRCIH